jgi:geranylgeranyl pyrophosphate synthase
MTGAVRPEPGLETALAALLPDLVARTPAPLRASVRYALDTPGKRLRPTLVVAAYRAVRPGPPPEPLYRLALAVEVVHTYSLVHDDLPCMDDDALRRGRPTLHVAHGTARAVAAGAALIPLAFALLDRSATGLGLSAPARARLVEELAGATGAAGMAGGQWMDLEAEAARGRLAAEDLERIHRLKTGALLTASLRIGALAARAGPDALGALTRFGEEMGLAFQIVDDLLDVTRTAEELGKTAGKDAAAGKATYPSLFGVERARELAGERIHAAVEALRPAGIESRDLTALATYVLERDR